MQGGRPKKLGGVAAPRRELFGPDNTAGGKQSRTQQEAFWKPALGPIRRKGTGNGLGQRKPQTGPGRDPPSDRGLFHDPSGPDGPFAGSAGPGQGAGAEPVRGGIAVHLHHRRVFYGPDLVRVHRGPDHPPDRGGPGRLDGRGGPDGDRAEPDPGRGSSWGWWGSAWPRGSTSPPASPR